MDTLFATNLDCARSLQVRAIDDLGAFARLTLDAAGRLQALQHAWLRQTLDDCRAQLRAHAPDRDAAQGASALLDVVAPSFERAAQYLHGFAEVGRASGTAFAERVERCAWQGPHLLADGLEAAATMRAG